MRKILTLLIFCLLSGHAFAVGGTCPSGANYLKESTNSKVTLSSLGVTSCVFVASNGLDTNTGLDEAHPWLHAPHMTSCASSCSSFTMAAGIGIIFRGGDTWHLGNSGSTPYVGSASWSQSTAGNSSNPVYIGFDPTWFSGGSWSRPILNGDNALWVSPAALPSSCPTHDFNGSSGLILAAFNIIENIEITGVCSAYIGTANPTFLSAGDNDLIEYVYYHGWTLTSASKNLYAFSSGANNGGHVRYTHVIMDGSDSPHWATGDTNCQDNGNWQCATGQGIYDHAEIIEYSVFRYTANHGVMTDTISMHDNLIEFEETAPTTTMTNAQHADAFMVFSGTLQSFYNNVTRHNYATQIMYTNVNSGGTLYIFNNVWYDNLRYAAGNTAPTNCVNLAAQTAGGSETLFVYNNTFDNDTDDATGGGCQISIYGTTGGNSNGFTWSGNVNSANNHLIGYANLSALYVNRSAGASFTVVDNGGNVIQTTTTARSQGYTQAQTPIGDAPTSGGSTIAAGTNESASCSTFSADSSLCSGTSGGASAASGVLSYPAITINSRGTTWNAGAFQFAVASISQTINGVVQMSGSAVMK